MDSLATSKVRVLSPTTDDANSFGVSAGQVRDPRSVPPELRNKKSIKIPVFPMRYFNKPDAPAACTSAPVKRSTFLSATNTLIASFNSC